MRYTPLIPAALVSCALAAQPAEQVNLVQRFNTELPIVNQLLKELKFQDAVAKADAMVPAQKPVFDPKDIPSIGMGLENGRGMLAILKLQASTQASSGQWEKAQEINGKRVEYAQSLKADVEKAIGVLDAQWTKVVKEGEAYIAQNEPKAAELEKKLAAIQADIKDVNDKKVTLDKKAMAELQARAAKAPEEDQELADIRAKITSYRDAMNRQKQFNKWKNQTTEQVDGMVKDAKDGLDKINGTIKGQTDEIAKFNADQNDKLKKAHKPLVSGNKGWVEAVMKDHTNLTKMDRPQDQAGLLLRLLILDPDNKGVTKALDNLKQGREPFFTEKAGPKGKKK